MPIFEDDELKRGETMPEDLKKEATLKKKRLAKARQLEVEELEEIYGRDATWEMD